MVLIYIVFGILLLKSGLFINEILGVWVAIFDRFFKRKQNFKNKCLFLNTEGDFHGTDDEKRASMYLL